MLFNTVIFKKRTYKEIMLKYNLVCIAVRKAKEKLNELYSQNDSIKETIITQEELEKNEIYLEALTFASKAFDRHTDGYGEEASEKELEEIFEEIQAEYNDNIHELYISTKYNLINSDTYIKNKRWKARALGWILGINPKKTEYEATYFHQDRIYKAINNLYRDAYFYVSEHDTSLETTLDLEITADFNLLMEFAKTVFRNK